MLADLEAVKNAWLDFHAKGVRPPKSEAEYAELYRFMDELTLSHDIN